MNALMQAILQLKRECNALGEDLYAIEIGEETFKKLSNPYEVGCPSNTSDDRFRLSKVLGATIYLHRRTLHEHSTRDLLAELEARYASMQQLRKAIAGQQTSS